MITLWLTIALLGVVGWVIYQFNTLVGLSNHIDEVWAEIDAQFVRRYELVARLLDLVQGNSPNDAAALSQLAAARTAAMNAYTPAEKSKTEPPLTAGIATVFSISQSTPNEEFSQLQHTLVDIEDYLRTAGRSYNTLVNELNARAGTFPNSLLASLFGVELREAFQPDAAPPG